MKRKIVILIVLIMVLVCGSSFANQRMAIINFDRNPVMRSVITSKFNGQTTIVNSNTISVSYKLEGRNIDKNRVVVEIQQYKNGRWMTVSTNSYTKYASYSYENKNYSVSSNYTYRAKLTGKVYKDGKLIETSYVYTNEVDC